MSEIEKAIETIKHVSDLDTKHHLNISNYDLFIAVEALREKQERENPKPLTIEELREMDGEPVWKTETGEWMIIDGPNELAWGDGGSECIFTNEDETEAYPIYYRHKPKDEG